MVWHDLFEPIKYVTVSDMYEYVSLVPDKPLLTGGNTTLPDFLNDYSVHWPYIDVVFNDKYCNSYYFNQRGFKNIGTEEIDEVYTKFIQSLFGFYWMNEKKYNELYRINNVDDQVYSIIDNYDVTETKEGEGSRSIVDAFGNRVIQEQETVGSQTNTMTDEVAPYDSDNFSNNDKSSQVLGSRQDSSTTTHNQHTDNHNIADTNSYTLTKKGNIGVQTQSEVMQKHVNFWKNFSFYQILFDDINKEFLLFSKSYI